MVQKQSSVTTSQGIRKHTQAYMPNRLSNNVPLRRPHTNRSTTCPALLSCVSGVQFVAFIFWNRLILIPLNRIVSVVQVCLRFDIPTCSWTQPSTQRHLSVVEYCAYDMFVLASKHQEVLCSLPNFFPLQKRGQMLFGPSAYPG